MTVPHRARDPRHGAAAARPRTAAERGTKAPGTVAGQSRRGAERGHRQPRHGGPGRGEYACAVLGEIE